MRIVDFDFVVAVGVGMARLYPCVLLIPVFSAEYLKGLPRHAIVLALALIPAPGIREFLSVETLGVLGFVGLLAKELLLGGVIGILLAMPFWMFESVGALFDSQRGALMGGQINPNFGPSDTPTGRLFRDITIYLLIMVLGFSGLVQLIWDSYKLWPPTAWFPRVAPDGFEIFLGVLDETLRHMVLYAAPFIVVMLLVEFAMGVMNLFSPQLNVFLLSVPAKSLIGFAFLLLYLPTLLDLMAQRVDLLNDLPATLTGLFQAPP
nr:type III secretion system export apparatus subunit SctT [Salinicola sp. S1-1-2]